MEALFIALATVSSFAHADNLKEFSATFMLPGYCAAGSRFASSHEHLIQRRVASKEAALFVSKPILKYASSPNPLTYVFLYR